MFPKEDVHYIRELAAELKNISQNPVHGENIVRWKNHNSLKDDRPMVFVHPDGAWNELLPWGSLLCSDNVLKGIEYQIRQKIIRAKYVKDDVPIIGEIIVRKIIHNSMWGIRAQVKHSDEPNGAWSYVPIIEKASDWEKLSFPVIEYDEHSTQKIFDEIADCFGDMLPVRLAGVTNFSFHLMHWYCDYRGLDNMLADLYDEPEMVHFVMRFFADGIKHMLAQYEKLDLISPNSDDTFHYTGGLGYTDELPNKKQGLKLSDVWGAAEAQEFSCVSPEMHEEFVLQYERGILQYFGLNGYGCCDDLSRKLNNVLKIKNLRRIAVCPWADIAEFTPVLKKDYIMTWKPQPAHLAYDKMDEHAIYTELSEGIKKAEGGILELILRDTHTCKNEPERFNKWISIARKAIN